MELTSEDLSCSGILKVEVVWIEGRLKVEVVVRRGLKVLEMEGLQERVAVVKKEAMRERVGKGMQSSDV